MEIAVTDKKNKLAKRKLFDNENLESSKQTGSADPDASGSEKNEKSVSKDKALVRTPRRATPLSERQQIALLRQLCSSSPCENSCDSSDDSCLSSGKKRQSARYSLLKRNERGETPLHLASIKSDIREIRRLLNLGVDVNASDFAGWTALHEACNHGWLDVATLLIQFGANVNAQGFGKDTPLHDAAVNGHYEIVNLLLKHGADPNQKNANFKSPFEVARSEKVVAILKRAVEQTDQNKLKDTHNISSSNTYLRITEEPDNWQCEASPCHSTTDLCELTMRKNSPQNHTHKGADKPTSPRLTLRFHSIRSRDDKSSNNTKVNDVSSTQSKYPSYSVTMQAKGDVYEFQKDDAAISSTQSASSAPESDAHASKINCVNNNCNKELDNMPKDLKIAADSAESSDNVPQVEKMDISDVSCAKINGGRLSERDYSSDAEKEENRCKRRKSSDSSLSRHSSFSHSSVKGHKSPSKVLHQDSHGEQRSPKGKKRSLSSSDTESNPSDSEPQDSAVAADSAASSNHNGAPAAGLHSPKVPPLKIVIPSSSSFEEARERSKVSSSKTPLPYVVNTAEAVDVNSSDTCTNVVSSDANKEIAKSTELVTKSKDDIHPPEERFQRVTRSSQRMQAAMSGCSTSSCDVSHSNISSTGQKGELSGESSNEDQLHTAVDVHPRKRKLRTRENANDSNGNNNSNSNNNNCANTVPSSSSSTSSSNEDSQQHQLLNSYQMYLNIRKQVDKRRKSMFIVHPKPPQGYRDYLLNRCSYVLEGNAASRLSVPMISPPQSLEGSIKELFIQQEKERYKLRLQHLIEREKLVLSAEQEILRVHGRAARAMANQTVPLSVCSILKDEEIYNVLEADQEDKDKNVRSRYNGRLFLSWLQDVDDKWEKIKEAMLLRHHNEAESLHAVQKLDWEWKMKELAMCDMKSTPVIDDLSVPMVHVSDDFDLLPA